MFAGLVAPMLMSELLVLQQRNFPAGKGCEGLAAVDCRSRRAVELFHVACFELDAGP